MPFDQYHEPANELSEEIRSFARVIMSMIEEADAIDWYEQRMSVEKDREAVAIMQDAQQEEFKHFAMDLEWLLRRKPKWRVAVEGIVGKSGDIVANAKQAEEKEDRTGEGLP
ncbi:MAG TPA: hypothetical protein VFA78_07845 [Chloroflexota bacterium]|nr:hypothetical protein [Chloroflexota bacterium]